MHVIIEDEREESGYNSISSTSSDEECGTITLRDETLELVLNNLSIEQKTTKENERDDPLLKKDDNRFVLFPLKRSELFDMYKLLRDISAGHPIYPEEEKELWEDEIKGPRREERIVMISIIRLSIMEYNKFNNIVSTMNNDIAIAEGKFFYGWQDSIEFTKFEILNKFLSVIVADNNENKLKTENNIIVDFLSNYKVVTDKETWVKKWLSPELPYCVRIVAFAVFNGIFGCGTHAAMMIMKKNGKSSQLAKAFDYFEQHRCLYTDFSFIVNHFLVEKASFSVVRNIIKEAVEIEKSVLNYFVLSNDANELLQKSVLYEYVEYSANSVARVFGLENGYYASNPLGFLQPIVEKKKDNFEKIKAGKPIRTGKATKYQKTKEDPVFSLSEDF